MLEYPVFSEARGRSDDDAESMRVPDLLTESKFNEGENKSVKVPSASQPAVHAAVR